MSDKAPIIYIEACPLIDMAQVMADGEKKDDISNGVWFCQQALRAARDKKMKVLTSFLSIAECTSINDMAVTPPAAAPSPPEKIRQFYEMLLLSGKSGMELVPITQNIAVEARNLRWVSNINLRGADTIHVASAMRMKCDELWTRDGRIWSNRVKLKELGIVVVKPFETNVLPDSYRTKDLI
jgi:hypothetical protein